MKLKLISVAIATLMLGACSQTLTYTPPQSRKLDMKDYNIKNVYELKTGKACVEYIAGFQKGDSISVITAMQNGNINTLKMVDIEKTLGFMYAKTCMIAYGE